MAALSLFKVPENARLGDIVAVIRSRMSLERRELWQTHKTSY
jgi:hypothetical protein